MGDWVDKNSNREDVIKNGSENGKTSIAELDEDHDGSDPPDILELPNSKDVESFKKIQAKELQIFLERRAMYGNHLENAKRFPYKTKCGLYLKCTRIVLNIENDEPLNEDTLIDLSNYATLILSSSKEV